MNSWWTDEVRISSFITSTLTLFSTTTWACIEWKFAHIMSERNNFLLSLINIFLIIWRILVVSSCDWPSTVIIDVILSHIGSRGLVSWLWNSRHIILWVFCKAKLLRSIKIIRLILRNQKVSRRLLWRPSCTRRKIIQTNPTSSWIIVCSHL